METTSGGGEGSDWTTSATGSTTAGSTVGGTVDKGCDSVSRPHPTAIIATNKLNVLFIINLEKNYLSAENMQTEIRLCQSDVSPVSTFAKPLLKRKHLPRTYKQRRLSAAFL